MATLTNQDEYIKTALRLPRALHAAVQDAAERAGRSMNAEIVARLQETFDGVSTGESLLGILALSGRLDAEIAEARLEGLDYLSALAACVAPLQDVLDTLEQAGLDTDMHGLESLEHVVENYNFSESWLKNQRKKFEEHLERAKARSHFADEQLALPGFQVPAVALAESSRDVLLRPLTATIENPNPPRTPRIPGHNAPKEGLGGAPKKPKEPKARTSRRTLKIEVVGKKKDE